MSLLFDVDPITAIRRIWHEDADGQVTFETEQDVTEIVEDAKGFERMFRQNANWKGEMHRVASIPMPIFMQLQREGIVDDDVAFKKWLNGRNQRVFRTRPGVV